MWIRTQDRKVLINVDNMYINQKDDKYSVIADYCNDNWFALGTYSSEERAIEVLDEIQKRISPDFNFNGNDKETDLFVKTQILNSMIAFYQMPKE